MLSTTLPPTCAGRLPPAVPTDYICRLSVEQYHDMIRSGILTDDDPVELLEGWLVTKIPKNPPHRIVNRHVRNRLERLVPSGWHINVQEPVTLDTGEPEPDISAIRGEPNDYADRNPAAKDTGLVVEISESTLARDRGMKKRSYARSRTPVYWIVNLIDRMVEVYTQPSGPAEQPDYAQRQDFGLADTLPVVIDGKEIGTLAVAELLG
jgi:Uma2 family endonuclease